MRRGLLFVALLLLPVSASAQQAASPIEQALSFKLSREMSDGIQCNAAAITLQQDVAAAKERIKVLEEKYEPKPSPKG